MTDPNEDANTPERRQDEDAQRYPAHEDPRQVIDPDSLREGPATVEKPPVREE